MPDERIDLQQVRTYPLCQRDNKVRAADFAQPPRAGRSCAAFMQALPDVLAGRDLRRVVRAVVEARERDRAVALAMGAHVIKVGLSPVVIDLMRRGVFTSVALNGAGAIHDAEIALIGATSEDVGEGLATGRFGMAEETGRLMNEPLLEAWRQDGPEFPQGMGELLGRHLLDLEPPHRQHSILAAGVALGVPVTVHVAIGTDIVHMHPNAHGGAIGQATFNDFRRYAAALRDLGDGGVYLNVGSAVLLPELFLKALTLLRNLGHEVGGFTAVNMDMEQHYRPLQNVVRRPTADGGQGIALTGRHELMVPLLAQAIVDERARRRGEGGDGDG